MPKLLSTEQSQRLRSLFDEAGYTEPALRKHLGAAELPSRQLRNYARLLDRTSAPTELNTLLRAFWLGIGQERGLCAERIRGEMLALLLESGLLEPAGNELEPRAMILPMEDFLVASDHASAMDKRQAEMVLWPNPTSKFLSRFAVRKHSRATLDLGTGSGILSLVASQFSDQVVATDLNTRAVEFARFNARFNARENIEVHAGDCFAPVAGRKFDLILSNPPFFITPQTDYLFCDNPMDLDGLCRRLVKEGPNYLNEGGYMEMLCEWPQIKGQPWEERVAEWAEGTGCDAWVMKGLTQDPEEYAQHRIREVSLEPSQDAENYAMYMNYYRNRNVEAIHDGLVILRRREGQNFIRVEEVPTSPAGDLGQLVLSTFAVHDLLRENDTEEKLLEIRPKLADNVRLEHFFVPAEDGWQTDSLTLRLTSGFPFHMAVQPLVAQFLSTCDGHNTTRKVIEGFAARANAPFEKVKLECLGVIRKLIERGFIVSV